MNESELDSYHLSLLLFWHIYEQWSSTNGRMNPVDTVFNKQHVQQFKQECLDDKVGISVDELAQYGLDTDTKIEYFLLTGASLNNEHDSIYQYLQTSPHKTNMKILQKRLVDILQIDLSQYIAIFTETAWTLNKRLKNDIEYFKHTDLSRQAEELSIRLDAILN